MKRRNLLATAIAVPISACTTTATTPGTARGSPGKTYVLVHGAWHGGWCWSRVAPRLQAMGHRVIVPTQTGLGERKHLLAPSITLDTFVADIVNVIEAEEANDVILVGHSFGGLSISGVADRIPTRIRHLVFLDSLILQPNQSVFGALPPESAAARRKAAAQANHTIAAPAPAYLGVPDGPDADWVKRRMTPHPVNTWDSPLSLANPVGNGRPCTYIACVQPQLSTVLRHANWARAQPGWTVQEIKTGHDAMVTDPATLSAMLAAIA